MFGAVSGTGVFGEAAPGRNWGMGAFLGWWRQPAPGCVNILAGQSVPRMEWGGWEQLVCGWGWEQGVGDGNPAFAACLWKENEQEGDAQSLCLHCVQVICESEQEMR